MAYLIKTGRSPFWYLRFRDLETGRWREENLKLRHDDPKSTLQARKEVVKRSAEESIVAPALGEDFASWVPDYIRHHYRNENSMWRYLHVWETLSAFFAEKGVRHPREVKYDHARQFMEWRKSQGRAHNTARLEVKHLSFLLSEAIRREYLERNVIALARIPLAAAKEKRELTDEGIQAARAEFAQAEPWMATVFEVLIHLGCRFNEARIHRSRIDFGKRTIQIEDSKREDTDPRKFFTSPLPAALSKVLKSATFYEDWTMPPTNREANRDFNAVLSRAVRGASSHCCRVSFISRCHRAGLSESEAMRLVNHSSRMVHRVYSKLNVKDARSARRKVILPPLPPRGMPSPSAA